MFKEALNLTPEVTSDIAEGDQAVDSAIDGSVWELVVKVGDTVEVGQNVCLIESMKMEVPITTAIAGTVSQIFIDKGDSVRSGQALLAITPAPIEVEYANP